MLRSLLAPTRRSAVAPRRFAPRCLSIEPRRGRPTVLAGLIAALAIALAPGVARATILNNITVISVPAAWGAGTRPLDVSGDSIVGYYRDQFGTSHGFLYDGTTYTKLDGPPSIERYARGIDGSNVVGTYADLKGTAQGFLFDGSSYTTLSNPLAATGPNLGTYAEGIDGDNIVGYYFDAAKHAHGFLYNLTSNTYTTIDNPHAGGGTGEGTFIEGISGGNLVGYYSIGGGFKSPFLFNGTSFTSLDPPFGTHLGSDAVGYAQGISGTNIIGNIADSSPAKLGGFLYDGTTYDSIANFQLYGISGNKIVGTFVSSVSFPSGNPSYTGFVATIPEPTSLVLGLAGAVGLWLFVCRVRKPRR
ncbi:MAG: hypothetical protein AB7U73_16820 [Pirellulales bacterium]